MTPESWIKREERITSGKHFWFLFTSFQFEINVGIIVNGCSPVSIQQSTSLKVEIHRQGIGFEIYLKRSGRRAEMGEIYILWTDWCDNGTWKADFPTLSTLSTSSSHNLQGGWTLVYSCQLSIFGAILMWKLQLWLIDSHNNLC